MDNETSESHESLWRRKLSEAERAELRTRPELDLEARLTDGLRQMPNVPVSSNFTARVLAAIELEEAQSARAAQSKGWHWNWHRLLPRMAVTAAVLLFAGVGIQRHEAGLQRVAMVKSMAQTVPSMEALGDFDVIQRMSQSGHADTDLLVALE